MEISLGAGLIIIALTTQWLLWKRLKDSGLRKIYAWIAWIAAAVGGTAVASDFTSSVGIGALGAGIASSVMILFILVDLKDRRPDWLAFVLVVIAPTFMRLSGGWLGDIFDLLLLPLSWASSSLAAFFGA